MAKSTIRLELNSFRTDKEGKAPIRIIYQLSGQRKIIPTGVKIYPDNWKNRQIIYLDKRTAKIEAPHIDYALLPLAKDVEALNEKIEKIKTQIAAIEYNFENKKVTYSPDMVIDAYNKANTPETKKDQSRTLVPQYIDKYIDEQRTTKTKGSLIVYKSLKNHLATYATDMRKKVAFSEMDKTFFLDFQNYLIEKKTMRNTTVAKQLSTLKTILNYAESCDIEVNTNYRKFEIKREPLPVFALTQSEFSKLFFFDFSDYTNRINGIKLIDGKPEGIGFETLDKVRDLFCFACVTGLRYSDLNELKFTNITEDEINITVVKTKQKLHIPLNEYAMAILTKYKDSRTPLPRMTNQRVNEYLKVIGKHVGILDNIEVVRFKGATRIVENYPRYEMISVHTGRKTFCTLSLEKGMSAEQVMAISGHKDYKSFKRYVNVTNEIKKQAITKAWAMPKILSIAK